MTPSLEERIRQRLESLKLDDEACVESIHGTALFSSHDPQLADSLRMNAIQGFMQGSVAQHAQLIAQIQPLLIGMAEALESSIKTLREINHHGVCAGGLKNLLQMEIEFISKSKSNLESWLSEGRGENECPTRV